MKKFASILIFIVLSLSVFGQEKIISRRTFLKAKIVDNQDKRIYIPFAHSFNESLRTSAITDTAGILKIRANENDTLVITAVGYYPKVVVLNDWQLNAEIPINLIMKRRTYEIDEVSVHALGTYQQFRTKVENLDLPYTETETLRAELKEISVPIAIEALAKAKQQDMLTTTPLKRVSSSPFTIMSQNEKQLKKYKEMLKKEERKTFIYAKYNKVVIKKLTKLDEPELTDFYAFCNFNEDFLFDATEYEIGEAIKNKFALYLAAKEKQNEAYDTISP